MLSRVIVFQDFLRLPKGLAIAQSLIDKLTPEDTLRLIGEDQESRSEFAFLYKDMLDETHTFLKEILTDDDDQPVLEKIQKGDAKTLKEIQEGVPSWRKQQTIEHLQYLTIMSKAQGAEEQIKNNVLQCANLMLKKAQQAPKNEENKKFGEKFKLDFRATRRI